MVDLLRSEFRACYTSTLLSPLYCPPLGLEADTYNKNINIRRRISHIHFCHSLQIVLARLSSIRHRFPCFYIPQITPNITQYNFLAQHYFRIPSFVLSFQLAGCFCMVRAVKWKDWAGYAWKELCREGAKGMRYIKLNTQAWEDDWNGWEREAKSEIIA
jgi:hypothetical protein